MEKREMLVEIKEKTDAVIIKEFSSEGAIIEYNSSGEAKGEKYRASHMETTDVKMKMDGTNEWESRSIEMTKEGDVVMISGKGTGKANNFSGEVTYMTNSPRLSWLNNTKGHIEGSTDIKGNEATIKVWAEKKEEATNAAMM
ncbi:MAG: hypothetical protein ACLQO7_03255 [Candidatus Bathyarchaeia archaeon]